MNTDQETSTVIEYDFAEEYTKFPGGRFIKLGKFSGEDFRDNILEKIFESKKKIIIDATNVLGSFTPSFLDECFGGLAKKYGIETFNKTVTFYSNSNPKLSDKMKFYVNKALASKND